MRTIAQISDLHFGHHDPAVAEALLASLQGSSSDLVVVSGDLTQRARRHEFIAARDFLGDYLVDVPTRDAILSALGETDDRFQTLAYLPA